MPEKVQSLLVRPTAFEYKRYYSFMMNIMEEIFEIRSCI